MTHFVSQIGFILHYHRLQNDYPEGIFKYASGLAYRIFKRSTLRSCMSVEDAQQEACLAVIQNYDKFHQARPECGFGYFRKIIKIALKNARLSKNLIRIPEYYSRKNMRGKAIADKVGKNKNGSWIANHESVRVALDIIYQQPIKSDSSNEDYIYDNRVVYDKEDDGLNMLLNYFNEEDQQLIVNYFVNDLTFDEISEQCFAGKLIRQGVCERLQKILKIMRAYYDMDFLRSKEILYLMERGLSFRIIRNCFRCDWSDLHILVTKLSKKFADHIGFPKSSGNDWRKARRNVDN